MNDPLAVSDPPPQSPGANDYARGVASLFTSIAPLAAEGVTRFLEGANRPDVGLAAIVAEFPNLNEQQLGAMYEGVRALILAVDPSAQVPAYPGSLSAPAVGGGSSLQGGSLQRGGGLT